MLTKSTRALALTTGLSAVLAAGLVSIGAPAAHADDTVCRTTIGAVSIDGDIVVPSGASCTLNGTTVEGNVKVYSGASLKAQGVVVDGNVEGENHRRVIVKPLNGKRSVIDGNIQVEQGGGGRLIKNVVNGDIQVFSNKARFTINRNSVDGNLQCKSNSPKPRGTANRVGGNKENQCRRM